MILGDVATQVSVVNCTFARNSSVNPGGAVNNTESHLTVKNSVFFDNTEPQLRSAAITSVAYSLIPGGWPGTGNIDADPRFVDPNNGDFRLRGCSPAIDAGSNSAVPAGVVTDAAGQPRFVDQPDVPDTGEGAPPIVDMGAFEHQGQTCPLDLDGSCAVDLGDLTIVLGDFDCTGTCAGDLNADGATDLADLTILLQNFGTPCP